MIARNSRAVVRRFAAVALLAVVACAPIATATTYKALPPKASEDAVEVFTDVRPTRPHEELGVIDVKSMGLSSTEDYGMLILAPGAELMSVGQPPDRVTESPLARERRAITTAIGIAYGF